MKIHFLSSLGNICLSLNISMYYKEFVFLQILFPLARIEELLPILTQQMQCRLLT